MDYVRRVVDDELDLLLGDLPAISLDGAKGVGKTATAVRRVNTVFALDHPATFEVLSAEPDRLTRAAEPILVDEWQRYPPSWDLVRRAVDVAPRPGRFLLTGSTSPDSPGTHSGAGRIASVRMRPLTLAERGIGVPTVSLADLLSGARPAVGGATAVGLEDYVEAIVHGGFPGMRASTARAQRSSMESYVSRILDRDFPEAGITSRNPAGLRRWLTAFAAATATTASFETIRDAATSGQGNKPAKSTTIPYRDALERIWVSDPCGAWLPSRSRLSRLTVAAKHFLADPALAVALLDVDAATLLEGRPAGPAMPREGTLLGALFESLVALNVRVYAQAAQSGVQHLRTKNGDREVDLVLTGRAGRVVAIEVKLAQTVTDHDVRHLRWLAGQIGPDLTDAVVITTGPEAYRRSDGVAVVPAALLGP